MRRYIQVQEPLQQLIQKSSDSLLNPMSWSFLQISGRGGGGGRGRGGGGRVGALGGGLDYEFV